MNTDCGPPQYFWQMSVYNKDKLFILSANGKEWLGSTAEKPRQVLWIHNRKVTLKDDFISILSSCFFPQLSATHPLCITKLMYL